MNKQIFAEQYATAIQKAAIGVYVIETSGPRMGIDRTTMDQNIFTMCDMLADRVCLDVTNIITDVMDVYHSLPSEFLRHPDVKQYIRELESSYKTLCLPVDI